MTSNVMTIGETKVRLETFIQRENGCINVYKLIFNIVNDTAPLIILIFVKSIYNIRHTHMKGRKNILVNFRLINFIKSNMQHNTLINYVIQQQVNILQ